MHRSRAAKLLDFVGDIEAAALSDRPQLLGVVIEGLARLFPCDRVVCADVDPSRTAPLTTATDPEFESYRRVNRGLWFSYVEHHPKLVHWARTRNGAAVRLSDLVSHRALHRLPIYDSFWRPFEIEYDFGLRLVRAPGWGTDLSCTRSRSDFSDDERDLLDALRPYLLRILWRSDTSHVPETLRDRFGISPREADVIAMVARGKTTPEIAAMLFLSPGTVRKHLEHAYAKLGVANRTQAAISAIEACIPHGPNKGELSSQSFDRSGLAERASVNALGLTRRELQVLALIATGESNTAISSKLSIAPETVKKHLDHIYGKLGVRRRNEAALRAVSLGLAPSEPTSA